MDVYSLIVLLLLLLFQFSQKKPGDPSDNFQGRVKPKGKAIATPPPFIFHLAYCVHAFLICKQSACLFMLHVVCICRGEALNFIILLPHGLYLHLYFSPCFAKACPVSRGETEHKAIFLYKLFYFY